MRKLLVCLCLTLAACGDDDERVIDSPPPPTIDAATPDASVPVADATPPTPDAIPPDATPCVGFGGEVREDMPGAAYSDLPPNEGATMTAYVDGVQVAQSLTIADGTFSLCVPPDTDIVVLVEETGFASYAFLKHTSPDMLYLSVRHYHEDFANAFWGSIGGVFPSATMGYLTVNTFGADTAPDYQDGVTITVSPDPNDYYYFDDSFTYDMDLTATSTAAFMAIDGVTPGFVNLSATHPSLSNCHWLREGSFASPVAGTLRIPVFNNTETVVDVLCE